MLNGQQTREDLAKILKAEFEAGGFQIAKGEDPVANPSEELFEQLITQSLEQIREAAILTA